MRAVFITDIHIGAAADGFQMQPRWIEGTPRLLERFAARMAEVRPELILVGGDTVEWGVPEQIDQATAFLAGLPARTLVCLGNHDLTHPDSARLWRDRLGGLKHVTLADAMIPMGSCDVIALNTHWLDSAGHPLQQWTSGQYPLPAMTEEQTKRLDEWLGRDSGRPAILVMHAQLNGVPAEVCGRDGPFEPPAPAFEEAVRRVIERHPRLRLTLSGHCHAACAVRQGGRVELTGTSYTETPHQFQVIEMNGDLLSVKTEAMGGEGSPAIVEERQWVCGRETDRAFVV